MAIAALLQLGLVSCTDPATPPKLQGCSNHSLNGVYVAQGAMVTRASPGTGANTGFIQALFDFDGTGYFNVSNGQTSEGGNVVPWEGRGQYTLFDTCVGTASLDTKVAGGIDVKMNFDLLVSSSDGKREIAAQFVTHPGASSGQLMLKPAER